MKIAFYRKENGQFVSTINEEMTNPKISGDRIIYDKGAISGLTECHILLDDNVDPPLTIEEAMPLNKLGTLPKVQTSEERMNELKKQLESISTDLQGFMDFFFNQP